MQDESDRHKSAHQPALPEVQGWSALSQLSHSLHAERSFSRVGLLEFIDKQMQNLYSKSDVTPALASVVTSALVQVCEL